MPALLAAAQERRVADDDVGGRPLGFARARRGDDGLAVVPGFRRAMTGKRAGRWRRQQRITLLDGVEGPEDGVPGQREAVVSHPLDFADPDRDSRQFGGIGIDLDAEHVLRPDHRVDRRQAQRLGFEDDLMLQILEAEQRQQQKIARAACRVQGPEPLQPSQKIDQQGLRLAFDLGTSGR